MAHHHGSRWLFKTPSGFLSYDGGYTDNPREAYWKGYWELLSGKESYRKEITGMGISDEIFDQSEFVIHEFAPNYY